MSALPNVSRAAAKLPPSMLFRASGMSIAASVSSTAHSPAESAAAASAALLPRTASPRFPPDAAAKDLTSFPMAANQGIPFFLPPAAANSAIFTAAPGATWISRPCKSRTARPLAPVVRIVES